MATQNAALPPMTVEERANLTKLAEAATPGPWRVAETEEEINSWWSRGALNGTVVVPDEMDDQTFAICATNDDDVPSEPNLADAAYIAAANPSVLLRLLQQVSELQRIADEARKLSDYCERGQAVYGHDFQGECYDAALTIEMQRGDIHQAREAAKLLEAQVREAEQRWEALKRWHGRMASIEAKVQPEGYQAAIVAHEASIAEMGELESAPPPATREERE